MSETQLMAKTPQLHPKQSIPVSYPNSPLSTYSGALLLQFSPGPFYTFVSLSLMVLYQFESLHLDDYNLTYRQNKNMGFDKFLTAFPLKTQHFPFTNIPQNPSKSIPINNILQKSTQHNSKTDQQQSKSHLYKVRVFPQIQIQEKEVRV